MYTLVQSTVLNNSTSYASPFVLDTPNAYERQLIPKYNTRYPGFTSMCEQFANTKDILLGNKIKSKNIALGPSKYATDHQINMNQFS